MTVGPPVRTVEAARFLWVNLVARSHLRHRVGEDPILFSQVCKGIIRLLISRYFSIYARIVVKDLELLHVTELFL